MKARTRKTRWLLIALLFGLLGAAGLMLTHHRRATLANANDAIAPKHAAPRQSRAALLALAGGGQTLTPPADTAPAERPGSRSSRVSPPSVTEHSNRPSNEPTARATGSDSAVVDPAGGPVGAAQPGSDHPSSSGAASPKPGAGDLAYNSGYAPLDCELPAGCGASASAVTMIRQPSGTSGGTPSLHTSQGSGQSNGDSGTQNTNPTNDNPPVGNGSGNPQQHSDPPGQGSTPPVASAPELDSATLAGAVTLLLGALAIVSGRRRRVRATR